MRNILYLVSVALFLIGAPIWAQQGSVDAKRIETALSTRQPSQEYRLIHRPIKGLTNRSAWHIGDSMYWVRLQPEARYPETRLDTEKIYRVKGWVLEQNYGTIDIWVESLKQASH